MYEKDFDEWSRVKQQISSIDDKHIVKFGNRDIWWGSIGVNVGHEEDGKGKEFQRPVIVVKKFNHRLFWGVPLTTQIKQSRHYYRFRFDEKEQCAMLTQLRLWDAGRLTDRMGRLPKHHYKNICSALIKHLI